MVSAGMTPMEVIVGSTGAAAAALELDHELGTLEAGKAADILIVAGDAAADVEALAAVQVVLKDGMIVFDAR